MAVLLYSYDLIIPLSYYLIILLSYYLIILAYYLLASPAFHRPRVIARSFVYVFVEFRNRKWSKMKDSEQTDIRFEFSSSRSISTRVWSPNGRNQPMFSTTFQFFGV